MQLSGIVVIDKPAGMTSHDVVQRVKKILRVKKAGHTGTLDPLATGVLPVCANEATKLVPFLAEELKEYRVTMRLGVTTDTLDIQGTVLAQRDVTVDAREIERILMGFTGNIEQRPPRYSAVKYRGRALYRWARAGHPVDAPPRPVMIYGITLESIQLPDVVFQVTCSRGTYVRSLCSDVGERLGCGACLYALRRTKSGPFLEPMAVSLDGGEETFLRDSLERGMLTMSEALSRLNQVVVEDGLADRLRRGFQPTVESLAGKEIPSLAAGDVIKLITCDFKLVALVRMIRSSEQAASVDVKEPLMRILRVFNA
jgi:tRNA pseudouridine55 synthase